MPTDFSFWLQVAIQSGTLVAMIIGLVGLIVPIFPGLVVIWLAALFYGLAAHAFDLKGWILFVLISLLMLVGGVIDNILMGAKARASGATWVSIWVSYAAALLGGLLLTPLAAVLCAPAGMFAAEWIHHRSWRAALRTVGAMLVGWGWSFVIRLIMGVTMIGLWFVWAWS